MKKIYRISFLLLVLNCFTAQLTMAQNVGIGTATPLEKLHIIGNVRSSTLAGIGNRLVVSDPNGTLINATGLTSPAWLITGNSGTVATTNFIGTIDSVAFILRTFNIERMRALANGQVSVNNAAPFATSVFSSYASGGFDAVTGAATGIGDGVYGQNTSTGATPGNGVTGISTAATGFGVGAFNTNTSGTAVLGAGNGVAGNYAVAGSGAAFTGSRVGTYSLSLNISGTVSSTGIIGRDAGGTFTMLNGGAGITGSAANSGVGVFAYNTGLTNLSHGVYSSITSTTAAAVLGIGGNSGVQGQTTVASGIGASGFGGANGDGIYGTATGNLGFGVTGFVTSGTSAIGVYGYADASGPTRFGGFFDNDLGSSGVKTFMIDHPLDPANKILKHFSMESPEVLNVYRGNVVLNSAGEAIVTLPDYFESINNTNYSYHITPIGAPAQLYVKQEIANKEFVIAGGTNGMKVSWIVYAERNDPYLQQNPDEREVIVNKTGTEAGKYVSPVLYGQPKESGLYYKNQQGAKATPRQTTSEKTTEQTQQKTATDFTPVDTFDSN
ncbi:MAG: hypothetical protein M3Q95_13355 [Bacteroidota bacterium]|nr:hypothetical protein [Bacteroidota bacterium]